MNRYVAVQEPTCTWAVFDTFEDVPAEFEDRVLVGMEKAEAMLLASACNARGLARPDAKDRPAARRGTRPALGEDARQRFRDLPLDEQRREVEKAAARTWRNR